jgi:hypothetical protein
MCSPSHLCARVFHDVEWLFLLCLYTTSVYIKGGGKEGLSPSPAVLTCVMTLMCIVVYVRKYGRALRSGVESSRSHRVSRVRILVFFLTFINQLLGQLPPYRYRMIIHI